MSSVHEVDSGSPTMGEATSAKLEADSASPKGKEGGFHGDAATLSSAFFGSQLLELDLGSPASSSGTHNQKGDDYGIEKDCGSDPCRSAEMQLLRHSGPKEVWMQLQGRQEPSLPQEGGRRFSSVSQGGSPTEQSGRNCKGDQETGGTASSTQDRARGVKKGTVKWLKGRAARFINQSKHDYEVLQVSSEQA